MKKKNANQPAPSDLPPDIHEDDLKYPEWKERPTTEQLEPLGLPKDGTWPGCLTFYRVPGGPGWVLTTLHISNPSSRAKAGTTARSYGIGVKDSKVYTVGRGPHVDKEVTVFLSAANVARLAKYVALWQEGMEAAGTIRDRISSRRAQGQIYRAAGRTHWNW